MHNLHLLVTWTYLFQASKLTAPETRKRSDFKHKHLKRARYNMKNTTPANRNKLVKSVSYDGFLPTCLEFTIQTYGIFQNNSDYEISQKLFD